jgi:bifunctional non-homologous end joining protein LigD
MGSLDPLIVKKSPLSVPVKKPKATWVQPIVDAEIEYGALTDDGLLREAVFKGLRDDLALPAAHAPPIVADRAWQAHKGRGGVPRENILQLLPDAVAPSKEELAAYWRKVAKRALPYLGGRPLKLVRHTRGSIFYHKGRLPPIPDSVHQLKACGFGSTTWPACSGWSRWMSSSCTPGQPRSTTSNIRTGWCSTSIPARASPGTS